MSSNREEIKKSVHNLPFSATFLAFGGSKMLAQAMLYPLDTIKTRMQSTQGFSKTGSFKNLYRGLLPMTVGFIPAAALGAYLFRSPSRQNEDRASPTYELDLMCFGVRKCVEAMGVGLLLVPFEIVKKRRQTEIAGTQQVVQHAFRNEGIFGLYRGFCSSVALSFSYIAISLPLLESIKFLYSEKVGRPLENEEVFSCYMFGVGLGAFLTTPLDVGKTRIMLHKLPEDSISTARKVPSLMSTLRSVYCDRGFKGLYAGCLPRAAFMSFEAILFGSFFGAAVTLWRFRFAEESD